MVQKIIWIEHIPEIHIPPVMNESYSLQKVAVEQVLHKSHEQEIPVVKE